MNPEKIKKIQKVTKIVTTVLTVFCFVFTLVMLLVSSNTYQSIKGNYPDDVAYNVGMRVGIYAFAFISACFTICKNIVSSRRKKKMMEKIPQEALAAIKMLPADMIKIIKDIPFEVLQ